MSMTGLIILLLVIGVALELVLIDPRIRTVIVAVVAVLVLLAVLRFAGLL